MDFSNPQNTSTDDLFNNLANGLLNGPPQGPTAGELALRGGPFRTGARALITGGAYGIGFATATFCSAWGMKVFVVDDDEATLNSARARAKSDNTLTTEITFMKMDVTNREEWKRVQKIVGVVDFLFLMKQTDVSELEWRNGDGFDEVGQSAISLTLLTRSRSCLLISMLICGAGPSHKSERRIIWIECIRPENRRCYREYSDSDSWGSGRVSLYNHDTMIISLTHDTTTDS